jgi:hypothetical protein
MRRGTDTITLFTHGRLEPGKGIDMVVRVFHALQDMYLRGIPPVFDHPLERGTGAGIVTEAEPSAPVPQCPFQGATYFCEKMGSAAEPSISLIIF